MNSYEILTKNRNIAVIGVTEDKDKYGYKIFKTLLDYNYNVYGISNKYKEVLNQSLYSSLHNINKPIDIVVFVVNKKFAYSYVDEMNDLGIQIAWMQPNTYDDELIQYMEGLTIIKDCILVQLKK